MHLSSRHRVWQKLACWICAAAICTQPTPAAAQEQPAAQPRFKINVIRGDGAQNRVTKGRATSQAVVEVRDENDRPVAGAIVTFTLPNTGPGGTFTSGGLTTTVTTNQAGQATATFTPNSVVGSYNIDVSAAVQGQTVTTSIVQTNLAMAAAAGGISGTTVGIIVAVVAAAAVGGAMAARGGGGGGNSSPAPAAVTPGLRIGIGGPVTIQPR
ncbi:MAG: hypothetical protein IT168_27015 [Bryobacterales bacterium]|nr:hypothetical protein [Bryobacterales bacterium]